MIGGPALTIIYFEDFAFSDILSIYPNILGTMNFVFVLSEPCMLFILRGLFSFLFHCQYFYRTVVYIWVRRWASYTNRNCLPFSDIWVNLRFFGESVLLILLAFCVVLCFLLCFSSFCVLCAKCCQCLLIVHSRFPLRFSLTFT